MTTTGLDLLIDGTVSKTVMTYLEGVTSSIQTQLNAKGTGNVSTVSIVTANGVSGSVANPTTTPAVTLTLGAITPSSVAASGTVTGSNLSGTNTGDQTNISGKSATADKLTAAVTINGVSFDGSANITVPAAAGTLTGATLAAGVTASSLISFGASPTIVTPTIASFANANHNHQNAAGGGTLDAAAIGSGTTGTGSLVRATGGLYGNTGLGEFFTHWCVFQTCNRAATTRTSTGTTSTATPAGTIGTTADEAEGPFQPWTTGAVSGNTAGGAIWSTTPGVYFDWLPVFCFRFKTPATVTSISLLAGLCDAIPSTDTPGASEGVSGIFLRYATVPADSGWVVVTSDGVGDTVSSQVLAFAASTAYLLKIVLTSTTSADIWLGQSESSLAKVATVSGGHFPTILTIAGASVATWCLRVITRTTATRQVKFGYGSVSYAGPAN